MSKYRHPWFGYAPAENVSPAEALVIDAIGDHDLKTITDDMWMDVIAEGKFNRDVSRSKHGSRAGAASRSGKLLCQCFLCVEWREEERRRKVKRNQALPLEDQRHPIHRRKG